MINLGIIGFGGIARNPLHVESARKTGRFFIKAVADINPDSSAAKSLGIPEYYTDYRQLLADPSIDAVLIATPHFLHEEQSIAAIKAGKHVLLEKPIGRNLEEARRINEASKSTDKTCMIGFCERYDIYNQDIKHKIDENIIGKALSARIDHYQNFDPASGSWWRSAEKVGGGAVIGSGVHRLDLLRFFFGEAEKVYAQKAYMPERLEAEACVHSVITFKSGVIANFSIDWANHKYLYYEGISIQGKNGMLVYQTHLDDTHSKYQMGHRDIENGILKDQSVPCNHTTMYGHFADCIEHGTQPLTSFEEGYRTQKLVEAVYRSCDTGNAVYLEDL